MAVRRPFTTASRAFRRTPELVAVCAAFALVVVAAPASAQTAAQTKCRDAIAKGLAKYTKTYFRVIAECHEARSSGQIALGVDCNDADAADLDGRLARVAASFRAAVGGEKNKCLDSNALLASQYPECPAPAETADDGGATDGIDDFAEVGECLLALTNETMEPGLDDGVGLPDSTLDAAVSMCQQTLAGGLGKLVDTILKERRKCQRTIDRQGDGPDYDCGSADPKGKIGRGRVRLNAEIDAGCDLSQAELETLDACGDTTTELRQCVEAAGMPLGSGIIRSAYDLGEGSVTTTTVDVTTTTEGPTTTTTLSNECGNTYPVCGGDCPSGTTCTNTGSLCECESTGSCAPATIFRRFHSRLGDYPPTVNPTQLSTGWSGSAHQVDIPGDGNSANAVDVVCDPNCENCSIDLNPIKDQPESFCRCASDPRTSCDVVNGPDTNDCVGGLDDTCHCYFGGPLAISAGGTPVCVLNRIKNDFGGTMNLRTGELYDTANLVSLVHLGLSTTQPCPVCNGDVTPNDGVRDGTCSGGLTSGACDVNGTHPTFGPVSFDCPPNAATNISGNGLQINLKFSTAQQSLAATLPCDDPGVFGDCPCRVCSGDGTLGCSSNADCAAAGAGSCTAGGGAGVKPSECADIQCSSAGECEAGPVDTYCDGQTHPDGRGYVTCVADADCAALGAGTCTISENRRCFPDPITVEGHADPQNPASAAIFCIPPTTSAAVNASGGLPGPGTFNLDLDLDIRCLSDINDPYQLPDGANCATVSTTTTTSITLPPCENSVPPLCVGSCGPGEGCGDVGAACGCTATTTTTLPPCGGAFPLCSGNCAPNQFCLPDVLSQTCLCTAPPL
jgi:hypothetical protein